MRFPAAPTSHAPIRLVLALLALGLLAPGARAEGGQGPVEDGPIVIGDLDLGTYWYGAEISKKDLLGKVVLVETWGS